MPQPTALLGTAGVYYVASYLNANGFHAAPTLGNAFHVDLLVATGRGSASLSLQVKTSLNALRTRGRGSSKKPYQYQWAMDCGGVSPSRNLFFVLVDLRGEPTRLVPDVFVVPSRVIGTYYRRVLRESFNGNPEKWKWRRYHPSIDDMISYKNNWKILKDALRRR